MTARPTIKILEWRFAGHRLAYVKAIAESAHLAGFDPVIVVTSAVRASAEYEEHLRGFDDCVEIDDGLLTRVGWIRTLQTTSAALVVIPEADAYLHWLLRIWLSRRARVPISIIVMRPPRLPLRRPRDLARGFAKLSVLVSLRMAPSIDIRLLENPMAEGCNRIWSIPFRSSSLRLDDPCDLVQFDDDADGPPELTTLGPVGSLLLVAGVLDKRKSVPEILSAWQQAAHRKTDWLVLAGKQSVEVRQSIREANLDQVVVIDRYLANDELAALFRRSRAVFVMYDRGLPSGVLVAAASLGRWVITTDGSRTSRLARDNHLGIIASDTRRGLVDAIERALICEEMPKPMCLPGRLDFGRSVIRKAIGTG